MMLRNAGRVFTMPKAKAILLLVNGKRLHKLLKMLLIIKMLPNAF